MGQPGACLRSDAGKYLMRKERRSRVGDTPCLESATTSGKPDRKRQWLRSVERGEAASSESFW